MGLVETSGGAALAITVSAKTEAYGSWHVPKTSTTAWHATQVMAEGVPCIADAARLVVALDCLVMSRV